MSNGAQHDPELRAAMARLASNFPLSTGTLNDALVSVTSAAVELIRGVDHADVLLIEENRFASMAPTAPLAEDIDANPGTLPRRAVYAGRRWRSADPLH